MRILSVTVLGGVPDGDPCDRCPRTLGRGGRRVEVRRPEGLGVTVERVCSRCLAEYRRMAA